MKKILLFVVLAVILTLSLSISADYNTFYDVIGDVSKLLGGNPDAAWNMSRSDAEATMQTLEGFSCAGTDDALVCTKNHWSGEFELTLYFADEKLAGVTCVMTGPTIQDLNWQPSATYIVNVEDLTGRLKSNGLLTDSATQQTGTNLFPDPAVSAYSPVYGIGSNSLLQPGYLAKSADNSKFRLAFIVASGEFADIEISLPSAASVEAADGDPYENGDTESTEGAFSSNISLSVSANEAEVEDSIILRVSAPGADGIRMYYRDSYSDSDTLIDETKSDKYEMQITSSYPSSSTYYAVASYNGTWSDTRSNEETISFHEATQTDDSNPTSAASSAESEGGEAAAELIEGLWSFVSETEDKEHFLDFDVRYYQEGNDDSYVQAQLLYFLFRNDGTFGRFILGYDNMLTIEPGTWTIKDGNYLYLTLYREDANLGTYYVDDVTGDMTVAVHNLQLLFRRDDNIAVYQYLDAVLDQALESLQLTK